MIDIILIAHNLRSCYNVGSLFRTCDGLGVSKLYLTGYTPHPSSKDDKRIPHLSRKISKQIHKTALGAEETLSWEYREDINSLLTVLKQQGYVIAAVEQGKDVIQLPSYKSPKKIALIVGREVEGIEAEVLRQTDVILEIPMLGKKESFNVVEAATMALYQCRFTS